MNVKVFQYIEELDAFLPTKEFKDIVGKLGLAEWNYAVFIGRLLCMDNDYGEHVFCCSDEREELTDKVEKMGEKLY